MRIWPVALLLSCGSPPGTVVPKEKESACWEATVGKPFPALKLRSKAGEPVKIVPGHVTLVWFWATWEAPSKQAFPKLQELYANYHARGFDVVGVSVDDDNTQVAEAAADWGAKFAIAWDQGHEAANCVKLAYEPESFVIDRKGVVRFVVPGYHDGEIAVIEQNAVPLLDNP